MGAYLLNPILEPMIFFQIILFFFLNSLWVGIFFGFRNKQFSKWSEKPPVSIIIPTYNKVNYIKKTIKSALSLNYPKKEIIVVDDGSTDGTTDICKKFAKQRKIRLITHGRNIGKSHALNTGIKNAKSDIVVTVDADSYPKPDSINKLVKYFVDPKIGAVAGTVKVLNKRKLLNLYQSLEYLQQGFQRLCQGFINAIIVAPGPLTAFRKQALIDAGYFEDDTLIEDCDMTIKLHKAGYKVLSEKNAIVLTSVPISLVNWWKQRLRWSRGGIQILMKHYDVMFNSRTRSLGLFAFPLSLAWLVLPYILLSTILLYVIPNSIIFLSKLYVNILNFTPNYSVLTNLTLLYSLIQQSIIDFFSLNKLNLTLVLGYLSVLAFLTSTFFSFRSLKSSFRPRDMKALIVITLYWYMLLISHVHAFLLELFKSRKKW